MAKRYYNLENEAKAYLKSCNDRDIVNQTNTNMLNDYIINRKNNNLDASFLARNPITLNGLVLWLDASVGDSYPAGGNIWKDLSNSKFNGTLVNNPIYSSANNGSLVFNGVNNFVQVTGSSTVSSATFIAWILRNGSQDLYDGIIYSRSASTNGMSIANANQLGYTWNNEANTYNWASSLTVPNLNWCMCAISISSTSATAYVCQSTGITSAINNVSHASTTIDNIKIGQDDFGSRWFTGNIAQCLIYNRALTSIEILQNFNATKSRFGL